MTDFLNERQRPLGKGASFSLTGVGEHAPLVKFLEFYSLKSTSLGF